MAENKTAPPGWNPALYGAHQGARSNTATRAGRPLIEPGLPPPLSTLLEGPRTPGEKSYWNMAGAAVMTLVSLYFAGVLLLLPNGLVGILGLAIGTAPGALLFYYAYWRNHFKDANPGLAFRGIALGYVGIPVIILAELSMILLWSALTGVESPTVDARVNFRISTALWTAFAVASLCEEAFKWCALKDPTREKWKSLIVSPYSYVIYGMMPALGLSVCENGLYAVRSGGGIGAVVTSIARFALTVPLHSATGAWMGYSLAKKHFGKADVGFFHMVSYPFLWHGAYDAVLFVGQALLDPSLPIEEQDQVLLGYSVMLSLAGCCCVFPCGIYYAYYTVRNMFKEDWYFDQIRPAIGSRGQRETGSYQPPPVAHTAWAADQGEKA